VHTGESVEYVSSICRGVSYLRWDDPRSHRNHK